jgi:hypothetical protein
LVCPDIANDSASIVPDRFRVDLATLAVVPLGKGSFLQVSDYSRFVILEDSVIFLYTVPDLAADTLFMNST